MNIRHIFDKINKTWIWTLFIFIVAFGIRLHYAADKDYNFWDEDSAIVICGPEYRTWMHASQIGESFQENKVYAGKDIWKSFYPTDNSLTGVYSDLKRIYFDNNDSSHTNFYYTLLRISFLGLNTDSAIDYIHRGLMLNFLLFTISFVLIYRLSTCLFDNKILIICTLAITFLNGASVGNALFIRMYQLQEVMFIIFALVFVYSCQIIADKGKFISLRNLVVLTLATTLTIMTGYFAIAYVFIMGGILCLVSLIYKQPKNLLFLVSVLVLGYVGCLLLYHNFNVGFKQYRAVEALGKITGATSDADNNSLGTNLLELNSNFTIYFGVLFLLLVSILALAAVFFAVRHRKVVSDNDRKKNIIYYMPLILFAAGALWTFIVFYLAPYKLIRYYVAVLPSMMLLIPFLLSFFRNSVKVVATTVLTVLLLGNTLMIRNLDMYWEKLYLPQQYLSHPEIPLVILNRYNFAYVTQLPLMAEERQVQITSTVNDFWAKIEQHNSLFAYYPMDSIHQPMIVCDSLSLRITPITETDIMEDYALVRIDRISPNQENRILTKDSIK